MNNALFHRKILWSEKAQRDLLQILGYWKKRNRSNVYPNKLNSMILAMIDSIAREPGLGLSS